MSIGRPCFASLPAVCSLATMCCLALIHQDVELPTSKTKQENDLPSAQQVIEDYIARLGGYEILDSRQSVHIQYDATKDGRVFESEIYIEPGKYYMSNRYASGRHYERGINNGVSWTCINGDVRQLHGDELKGILSRHKFINGATKWIESHKSIKCELVEMVHNRKAYKLHFVDQNGLETDRYFDCQTKLLLRSAAKEIHGTSHQLVVRDFFDYKAIGEALVPMKRRIEMGKTVYLYNVELFEVDTRIPKGTFDLPPSIKPISKRVSQD